MDIQECHRSLLQDFGSWSHEELRAPARDLARSAHLNSAASLQLPKPKLLSSPGDSLSFANSGLSLVLRQACHTDALIHRHRLLQLQECEVMAVLGVTVELWVHIQVLRPPLLKVPCRPGHVQMRRTCMSLEAAQALGPQHSGAVCRCQDPSRSDQRPSAQLIPWQPQGNLPSPDLDCC